MRFGSAARPHAFSFSSRRPASSGSSSLMARPATRTPNCPPYLALHPLRRWGDSRRFSAATTWPSRGRPRLPDVDFHGTRSGGNGRKPDRAEPHFEASRIYRLRTAMGPCQGQSVLTAKGPPTAASAASGGRTSRQQPGSGCWTTVWSAPVGVQGPAAGRSGDERVRADGGGGAVRGAGGAFAGDRADPVGELGRDLPVLRRAGGAGVVGQGGGVDGFGVGLVQAGEADAGLAGAVDGDDAVVGAAAEALHVADGDGAVGHVVGDLGQGGGEPAAELAGSAGVVAGAGAADQQCHGGFRVGVPAVSGTRTAGTRLTSGGGVRGGARRRARPGRAPGRPPAARAGCGRPRRAPCGTGRPS